MDTNKIIEQGAFSRRAWFRFGEDRVEFRYSDNTGELKAAPLYEAVDLENLTTATVRLDRKYILVVLVVVVIASAELQQVYGVTAAWALIVFYFLFLYVAHYTKLFSAQITLVPYAIGTGGQRLRVIKDKNHDEIMDRLRAGWVARMRKLHATVRVGADPTQEAQRFHWLLERQVIDEPEYQHALELIGSSQQQPPNEQRTLN